MPTRDPRDLLDQLLDRGYTQTVAPVVNAIASDLDDSGLIRQRLNELEAEAERLALAGEKLTPDNPVLRALRADLYTAVNGYAQDMNGAAGDVAESGMDAAGTFVWQTTMGGLTPAQIAAIGVEWIVTNPEAVRALVNYTSLPAWSAELNQFAPDVDAVVNNIAIRGFIDGWGSRRLAREIVNTVDGFPVSRANTLMRTLQMQSFRQAAAYSQQLNADILEPEAIWWSTLDNRVCLYCLSQHGTRLPLGAMPDAHHNCRCTTITVIQGRPRNVQSGEDWFYSLSEERQLEIAGQANYNALKAGAVTLQDFKHSYTDPVFGSMANQNSLYGILGEDAYQYYAR